MTHVAPGRPVMAVQRAIEQAHLLLKQADSRSISSASTGAGTQPGEMPLWRAGSSGADQCSHWHAHCDAHSRRGQVLCCSTGGSEGPDAGA